MSDERITRMEEKIVRIENEVSKLSDIKATVEAISVKLDGRTDHVKDKFASHEKRIDRLGLKFWGIIVLIVSVATSTIAKWPFKL